MTILQIKWPVQKKWPQLGRLDYIVGASYSIYYGAVMVERSLNASRPDNYY